VELFGSLGPGALVLVALARAAQVVPEALSTDCVGVGYDFRLARRALSEALLELLFLDCRGHARLLPLRPGRGNRQQCEVGHRTPQRFQQAPGEIL
jgi:hypothetical protein